ncbi:MAG TPA: ABC transporter substrate-binding protein, partial [Candidatus Limnocylindrales bacterium]
MVSRAQPSNRWPARLGRAFVVLAVVVAACGPAASPAPSPIASPTASPASSPSGSPSPGVAAFPLEVTDDEGTQVAIPAEPDTIVSLMPAVTETLFALGVGDRVAARTEDTYHFPPEAESIPIVTAFGSSGLTVNIEAIVAAEPDLVFAGGNFGTPPDAIARLRELEIPVVVIYAASVDQAFEDIALIGRAIGRRGEADEIVGIMRNAFDDIEAAAAAEDRPHVFYETGTDATGTVYGVADNSFLSEMIQLAGAEPVTTGSPTDYAMPLERLIAEDPEIILLSDAAFGETPELVAERPGWDVLTA